MDTYLQIAEMILGSGAMSALVSYGMLRGRVETTEKEVKRIGAEIRDHKAEGANLGRDLAQDVGSMKKGIDNLEKSVARIEAHLFKV